MLTQQIGNGISTLYMKMVQLPDVLMNRKLEAIVLPADNNQKEMIQESMTVSSLSDITQSLVESISIFDITLE